MGDTRQGCVDRWIEIYLSRYTFRRTKSQKIVSRLWINNAINAGLPYIDQTFVQIAKNDCKKTKYDQFSGTGAGDMTIASKLTRRPGCGMRQCILSSGREIALGRTARTLSR